MSVFHIATREHGVSLVEEAAGDLIDVQGMFLKGSTVALALVAGASPGGMRAGEPTVPLVNGGIGWTCWSSAGELNLLIQGYQ